jgi:hypothetical protein
MANARLLTDIEYPEWEREASRWARESYQRLLIEGLGAPSIAKSL